MVARCRPLFTAIAPRVFDAGPDPAGAAAIKIANNFVLGCAIEALGEGFALIRKYGVAPDVFFGVLTDGLFNCSAYKSYGKIIADENYLPAGQRAVNGLKDANLALAAAERPACRCRAVTSGAIAWSAPSRMAKATRLGRDGARSSQRQRPRLGEICMSIRTIFFAYMGVVGLAAGAIIVAFPNVTEHWLKPYF